MRSTTTLPQGRKACAAFWTGLDFEAPRGTMGGHPSLEIVIVVLIVPEDRLRGAGRLWPRSARVTAGQRCHHQPALVIKTALRSPSVSAKIWRLRPFTRLPPSYPRSGPPISVVLTD